MDLGDWGRYVGLDEIRRYYPVLPTLLEAELAQTGTCGKLARLSDAKFSFVKDRAHDWLENSLVAQQNPYHNLSHGIDVLRRGTQIMRMWEKLTGRKFPPAIRQHAQLALLNHDAFHCGCTFRADAAPNGRALTLPKLGTNVSAEWATAHANNKFGTQHQLGLGGRLFQTKIILLSTYGGSTPRGQELGIPDVKPTDFWGWMMRTADIVPPGDFMDWVRRDVAVNYGEIGAFPRPRTWEEYFASRFKFINVIRHCFNQLDKVSGLPIASRLGWRLRLAIHEADLERIKARRRPDTRQKIASEIAKYGFALS